MTIREMARLTMARVCAGEELLEEQVDSAFSSDMMSDVLAYATSDASQVNANTIVSAGGERDVWSVVLTSAQNQTDRQVSRSFKITYYIWGIPMSVTAKYN